LRVTVGWPVEPVGGSWRPEAEVPGGGEGGAKNGSTVLPDQASGVIFILKNSRWVLFSFGWVPAFAC